MGVWRLPLPGGASLVIEADLVDALRLVEGLQARFESPRALLVAWAAVLRESARQQFAEGGAPSWEPLKPSTLAAKLGQKLPERGGDGRVLPHLRQQQRNGAQRASSILLGTGAMRAGWVEASHSDHVEEIDVESGSVSVGNKSDRAGWHQRGTGPYTIRARLAKALAFTGAGGEGVLRRQVEHPGLPARPIRVRPQDVAEMSDLFARYLAGHLPQGDETK